MTDIETLLRDTFAAHEHLADQTSQPLLVPSRRSAPLLAVAAVVLVVALAAASVLVLHDGATPGPTDEQPTHATSSPTPPDLRDFQRSQAESQAQLLLTEAATKVLHFPGGAEALGSSTVSDLANLTTYAVDRGRTVVRSTYWSTTVRDPSGVEAWFAQHPVDGFAVARGPRYVEQPGGTPREELVLVPGNLASQWRSRILFQALPHGDGVAFRVTVVLHY